MNTASKVSILDIHLYIFSFQGLLLIRYAIDPKTVQLAESMRRRAVARVTSVLATQVQIQNSIHFNQCPSGADTRGGKGGNCPPFL